MTTPRPDPAPLSETELVIADLLARVRAYLTMGGLFNPELADHGRARDLIMDLRGALSDQLATVRALQQREKERVDVSRLLSDVKHYVVRDGVLEPVGAWPNRSDVLYRGSDLYAALTALQEPLDAD